MALLGAVARARVAMAIMREETGESFGFDKPALSAAVTATDQWIEDNTASYVAALPVEFRTSSTTTQKAILFAYVLWRRIGRLRVAEDS